MITQETLDLARRLRIQIDKSVNAADREIILAWARAWREISGEWSAAIGDLIDAAENGWPSRAKIDRAASAQRALALAATQVEALSTIVGVAVSGRLVDLIATTGKINGQITLSQLPQNAADWLPANSRAITAIVKRTSRQIDSLTRPLSREAREAMKSELVRGVTVGSNPRLAAQRMLQRTKGHFDGGLYRASNIARTEMLDAYRAASAEQHQANPTVKGWIWRAELSERTCGVCCVMHGTEHKLDEPGPLGHQQCRCTRIPQTFTWRELGYDLTEPEGVTFETGEQWFARQPRATQVEMMGMDRLVALDRGDVEWKDLARKSSNLGWRDSMKLVSPKGL